MSRPSSGCCCSWLVLSLISCVLMSDSPGLRREDTTSDRLDTVEEVSDDESEDKLGEFSVQVAPLLTELLDRAEE